MSDARKQREKKKTPSAGAPSSTGGDRKPAAARPAEPFTGPERVYEYADRIQEETAPTDNAEQKAADWETWVTFKLLNETFAFSVETIEEIVRVGTVTRVPDAPYPIRGILNLRARVVPVVDLRVRIGLPPAKTTAHSRVLIASLRGRVLGLLVDSVEQVARVDRNLVAPPPDDVMTAQSDYILGVYERDDGLVILLDSETILLIPESLQTEPGDLEAA